MRDTKPISLMSAPCHPNAESHCELDVTWTSFKVAHRKVELCAALSVASDSLQPLLWTVQLHLAGASQSKGRGMVHGRDPKPTVTSPPTTLSISHSQPPLAASRPYSGNAMTPTMETCPMRGGILLQVLYSEPPSQGTGSTSWLEASDSLQHCRASPTASTASKDRVGMASL